MKYIELNEGDVVIYGADMPYKLGNGQEVSKRGEKLVITSKVLVQDRLFNVHLEDKKDDNDNLDNNNLNENKVDEDLVNLDSMNKEQLIEFADEHNIDVDKRKGEEKLREELKNKLQ